jgi:hypothetical protein
MPNWTPPIAHAGHWIAGLLYLAPVAIVVGALAVQSWKDRRSHRRGRTEDDPSPPRTRSQ